MKVTNKIKQSGFSLIELIIVITIMGLLISLVAPEMIGKIGTSKSKAAKAQVEMLSTALDVYRLDVGTYPDSIEELRTSEKKRWDGPYLPKAVPLDPWDNPYIYKKPGENGAPYYLASLGLDGKAGGEDENEDIVHTF